MTPRRSILPLALTLLLSALALPSRADAQIWKKLKKTAKQAAEEQVQQEVDQLVRNKVRCVFDDPVCLEKAKADGQEVVLTDDSGEILTDDEGQPIDDPDQAAKVADAGEPKPGTGDWANYDFVPGERVLFADDYSDDEVGDFPRRMELIRGNWEIVDVDGRRLLRHTGPRHAAVAIHLPEALPQRFTIEMEVYFPHSNQLLGVAATEAPKEMRMLPDNWFQIGHNGTGVHAGASDSAQVEVLTKTEGTVTETLTPVRIMADERYVKVFVNERRVANVPNAKLEHGDVVYLSDLYFADEKNPMYIGPIRIAAGGRDLYDALVANGRVATHGILFATNSARIRPESTPTLEQIAGMLNDHAELRLSIEGHTDSDGDDAYNQDLSERRAAAVKTYLVDNAGIDATRLETAGFGASKPVAGNDTAEGKQQNRRVELVKLEGGGAGGR